MLIILKYVCSTKCNIYLSRYMQNYNIGNNNYCCRYEKSDSQDVPVVDVTKCVDCRPVRSTAIRIIPIMLN